MQLTLRDLIEDNLVQSSCVEIQNELNEPIICIDCYDTVNVPLVKVLRDEILDRKVISFSATGENAVLIKVEGDEDVE